MPSHSKDRFLKPNPTIYTSSTHKQNQNTMNRISSSTTLPKHQFDHNSRQVNVSSSTSILCSEQDGRKAAFKLSQNYQFFYLCEKCAIMAASQGLPVQKMYNSVQAHPKNTSANNSCPNIKFLPAHSKSDSNQVRQNTVKNLKQKVQSSQQLLTTKYNEVQELVIKSGETYTKLINQITSYFEVIQQVVQYQKHLTYNKVLNERINNQANARQFKDYIENTIIQLGKIMQDLTQNQDAVFGVEQEQFNFIINDYANTVRHTSDILDLTPSILVFESVTFPRVIGQLNQLSLGIKLENQQNLTLENANFKQQSGLWNKNTIRERCSKQIIGPLSQSMASSIVQNQSQSSQEQFELNFDQSSNQKFNFLRAKTATKLHLTEESIGQYFSTEQSFPINRTLNEKSQTFLLNH